MEAATLSTVLLVTLVYARQSRSRLEIFILAASYRKALFGTILLYFAAEKYWEPKHERALWTHLMR